LSRRAVAGTIAAVVGRIGALAVASLLATAGGCGGGGLALRPPPPGAGGTGGGAGGTGGTADAGIDVAVDAGRDDSDVAADAGAGGADAVAEAGAPDAGDAGDAGGSGFPTSDGVLCPRPAQALITDFTYVPGSPGTPAAVHFGDGTTLSGTEYVYPDSGAWLVTSDVTGNNWHITGNVGDYSGFGIVFDNCSRLDASAYRGISFTISGSVPQGSFVTMGVSTLNDTLAASWLNAHGDQSVGPGRCIPTAGTNRYTQSSCLDPTTIVPITSLPILQTILWSDFTGGRPEAAVTASDILAIYWYFPAPAGAGTAAPTSYVADIVLDNLAFVP
jgi:hypothetical protein